MTRLHILLCRVGIHDWKVTETGSFGIRMRECRMCGKTQQAIGLAPWRTLWPR